VNSWRLGYMALQTPTTPWIMKSRLYDSPIRQAPHSGAAAQEDKSHAEDLPLLSSCGTPARTSQYSQLPRPVLVKHSIYALLEVDVTNARNFIREHEAQAGEALSFTGYLAFCLARCE
jgi:hypothetical protein